MAKFHHQSLNTVRLSTIVSNGEVHVFAPFIRMGVGDSVVDNAFSGGLLTCIDESTGIVVTAGYDEHGKKYLKHPDTNISIIGFQIPNWDEAIKLVTKLAHIIEENRYTAWDIAYTKKGWIMVEANARGEILVQMVDKIGRKQQWLDLR